MCKGTVPPTSTEASDILAPATVGPVTVSGMGSGIASEQNHSSGPADTLTVGELCRQVEQRITDAFPDEVWVSGAISGLTRSANGHVYFDLVDPSDEMGTSSAATLPVALFASTKTLVNRILRKAGGVRMHDGIEIRIRGRVAYYPPQGRVQLIMSLIDPQFTLGQMEAARGALLERLRRDDLLERNGQLPMPGLPLRIGLVTSGSSAAFADFVEEIDRSRHPFHIILFDSRVQGLEAVPSLVAAIEATATRDVDVVVVTRGGGSRTDLVAFDHERVVTALARCPRPVIVGVGHEIDRSVSDEVAHTSAKTPTACAVVLIDRVDRFARRLDDATARLAGVGGLHLQVAHDRLVAGTGRLAQAATRVVERNQLNLTHAQRRLRLAPNRPLERHRAGLATAEARLSGLDPVRALRRGWSITRTVDPTGSSQLVRSIGDVEVGSVLETTTMDGIIMATTTSTSSTASDSTPQSTPDSPMDDPDAPGQ